MCSRLSILPLSITTWYANLQEHTVVRLCLWLVSAYLDYFPLCVPLPSPLANEQSLRLVTTPTCMTLMMRTCDREASPLGPFLSRRLNKEGSATREPRAATTRGEKGSCRSAWVPRGTVSVRASSVARGSKPAEARTATGGEGGQVPETAGDGAAAQRNEVVASDHRWTWTWTGVDGYWRTGMRLIRGPWMMDDQGDTAISQS